MAFDVDYQAVLTKTVALGGGLPSWTQQAIDNWTVIRLKSLGAWSQMDIFYGVYNDANIIYSSLNWKDPENHRLTNLGSVAWASNTGFTNDHTGYINTNWNSTNDGVNVLQNDCSFGMKVEADSDTPSGDIAVFGGRQIASGGQVGLVKLGSQGSLYYFVNTGAPSVDGGGADSLEGVMAIHRDSSGDQQLYKDGVEIDTEGDASDGMPSFDLYLLAENRGGTVDVESNATFSFFWAGASMDIIQDSISEILYENIALKDSGDILREGEMVIGNASSLIDIDSLGDPIGDDYVWEGNNVLVEVAGVGKTDTSSAQDGDFCIRIETQGTGNNRSEFNFPVTNGKTYEAAWWIKGAVGDESFDWKFEDGIANGTDVDPPSSMTPTTSWVKHTAVWTALWTGNCIFKIWNNNAIGDVVYVDSLSITEVVTAGNDLINGSANLTFSESVNLKAKGILSGISALNFYETSTLFGKGTLSGSSGVNFTNSNILTARGKLSGGSQITFSEALSLFGKGILSGSTNLDFTGNAVFLLPNSFFTASANLGFTSDAVLKGKGILSGATQITFGQALEIFGKGKISGQSDFNFSLSSLLKGKGIVSGSADLNFTSNVLFLLPEGFFSASSNFGFTSDAVLKGKGILTGSTQLTFDQALTLFGKGKMTGAAAVVFDSNIVFIVPNGFFTASSTLNFSNTALLKGKGILSGATDFNFTSNVVFVASLADLIKLFQEIQLVETIKNQSIKLTPTILNQKL